MKRFAGMLAQKIGIKQEMVRYYECLYDRIRTIQMYILKPLDDAWNKQNGLNVMSIEETIKYIIKNECSVARFGDGEFNIVSGKGIGFQSQNNQLTIELKKY